jgi:sugar O-acyltransferase (sialic acid O-acetyltransferase NeuD family)
MKPRLVIVGAGGHGMVVRDIVERAGTHEVVGYLDSGKRAGSSQAGLSVLGAVEEVAALAERHGFTHCLVAVGHNSVRRACVERITAACPSLIFPALVHPSVVVAPDVEIGAGTVVMAGGVLNPGVKIGRHCILNTGSLVDHETLLEDFASLAPGVVLGGNVSVGAGTAVCLGAKVVHGIRLGAEMVVGAGALVLGDLPDGCVAYGSPARIIRPRVPADRYL